jgi:outer membrane protein
MEDKMKKLFFLIVLIAVSFSTGIVLGEDSISVGVVDMQRCIQESQEGQKVFDALKNKKENLQKKLDNKQKELLELRKELEKQSMMLSMDAQENKKKDIERKARELEYFFKDLNEEMMRAQEKEKKKIFNELKDIIGKIGSESKYDLIIERWAGGVLYFDESREITDQVIKAYDTLKSENK